MFFFFLILHLLSFLAMLFMTLAMLSKSSLPAASADATRSLASPSAPLCVKNCSIAACITVPLAEAVELTLSASSSPTFWRQNLSPSFTTVAARIVDTDGA